MGFYLKVVSLVNPNWTLVINLGQFKSYLNLPRAKSVRYINQFTEITLLLFIDLLKPSKNTQLYYLPVKLGLLTSY